MYGGSQTLIAFTASASLINKLRQHSVDSRSLIIWRPACYLLLSNGDGDALHTPNYDFNGDLLMEGACLWRALVRVVLAADVVAFAVLS